MAGWRAFWDRGGWWKALLFAVVYYGVYQLVGLLVGAVFGETGGVRGPDGSPAEILIDVALPVILTSLLLAAFAASIGWLKPLFARQRVRGGRWMLTGVVVILAINASSLLSLDFAEAGAALVAAWLFAGLFVGFAEELVTRGFVVTLMRNAGHGEIAVGLVSAGVFAGLHVGNLFTSSQDLKTTLVQVVYTFFFGICMYLALRVTGNLIWPILIHASTDPTLFLHVAFPTSSPLSVVTALSTYLVIITGLILMICFIVSERRSTRRDLSSGTVVDTR